MVNQDDAPATKGDIRRLETDLKNLESSLKGELGNSASRDDLKALASKDDLEAFATKDDLKSLATKDDLKALATTTKEEIHEFKRTVSIEHARLRGEFADLKETVRSEMRYGVSRMLKLAEVFTVKHQKLDRRQILTDHRIDGLDKRVKTLEARPATG